ncbi:MAG: radical SAM protein [Planctomycetota bacterium]|nr:radical SAM protein [Planctomycetota bacterium]MDA0933418.1 radical SAM protein [Planctomycetota bacterium]MDA1220484.1 radical SAM protein [Planctomycetota bacterium]
MKIQLVHPPAYINENGLTALRPSLPLGLAYIAAVLREDGHEISVVDALGEAPNRMTPDGDIWRIGLSTDEVVERLDPDAGAIGVTNMWSYAWPIIRELLQKIRARFPDKPIVCGGEHFTATADLSMEQAPIDFIVAGEGEETAVALFRALEIGLDVTVIPGIVYRDESGKVVHTPRRDRIRNIDEIPWPAWDLFDVAAYDDNKLVTGIHYGRTVPILATRGCPYQCTYCSSPGMWTTRWFARTPEDVANEIEKYVRDYGAANFPFQDLTAILKRDWVVDFTKEILDRKLKITWQLPAGTRSEIIDDEVASLLVKSGCRSINLAPESGSERTRKAMKKMLTDDKLFRAARAATRNGLNVGIFLVLGYPTDEPVDMRATARMVRKLARVGVDDVSAGFFFPLPNTEIFRELEKQGKVVLDDDFLKLPIYVHNKFMTAERNYNPHMTARQMTRWKYWIVANFYVNNFLFHPGKVVRILWNFLRGRETSKMESFLQETKRKFMLRKGRKKDARPANVPAARPAVGAGARDA